MTDRKLRWEKTAPGPLSLMAAPPGNCLLSSTEVCSVVSSVYPAGQMKQQHQAELAPGILNPFNFDFLEI